MRARAVRSPPAHPPPPTPPTGFVMLPPFAHAASLAARGGLSSSTTSILAQSPARTARAVLRSPVFSRPAASQPVPSLRSASSTVFGTRLGTRWAAFGGRVLAGLGAPPAGLGAKREQSNLAIRMGLDVQLEFPPLPPVQFPPYERFELPNGMIVFVIEDSELPIVNGVMYMHAGGRWDKASQVGLAELVGVTMRSGGSKSVPAEKLDRLLEQQAAALESGADRSMFSVGFSSLSEDVEMVIELMAGMVREPAFPEEKLSLAKVQFEAAIARRNDDPQSIVGREYSRVVYGETSPYARLAEYSTIDSLSVDDLKRFHKTYVHPNNIILGVVGNVKADKLRTLLERHFGDWQRDSGLVLPKVPVAEQANKGKIFVVDRPDMNQAYVQFGQMAGLVADPDYFNLSMFNGVLNGFGGRLFNEVRSRQGLAYSVFGVWGAQFDHAGTFTAGGETGGDVAAFIRGISGVLDDLRTKPPTKDEVAYARDSTLNSFVFNFSSLEGVLQRLLRYEYYKYPFDYIFRFQRGVEACTGDDILEVTQRNVRPEDFVYVVVGPVETLRPSLETIGLPIIERDVTIPSRAV